MKEVKNSQYLTKSQLDQLQTSQNMTKTQIDQVKNSQINQLNSRVINLKQDLQQTVKTVVKQEVDKQLDTKLHDLEAKLHGQINVIKSEYKPSREQDKEEICGMVAKGKRGKR